MNEVAEVREMFPNVNKLIGNLKKVFLKALYHVQVHKEILPNVPLPPEPVLNRWGTWLKAAVFNCNNFEGFKNVIDKLSEKKSSFSIEKCKNMLHLQSVKNDMIFIKTNFLQIVTTIKSLEKSNTPLVDMINIIENTFTHLEQIPGEKGEVIKTKILQL
jgi:hypothetical protein